MLTESEVKYLLWLDKAYPEMYRQLYEDVNAIKLGATEQPAPSEPSLWDNIVGGLEKLVPVYLATEQQKQLNDINLQRAKAGLSPLDASDASTISTQVGLSPKTQQTILLGTGIVAAALVMPKLLGGSKRGR